MMTRPIRALAPALAVLILLPGCVSLGAKPPKQLLSLSADARVPVGTVHSGAAGRSITVMDPDTSKKLDTVRIPVQSGPTAVAYIKDAAWVDTPRHLFQRLLSETIAASGAVLVLDPGQYSADPGRRLLGELVDFGIDEPTRSAVVTYDATLAAGEGSPVIKKRFSATVPVSEIKPGAVGGPINQAANKVAAEVAAWVAGQ